MKQVKISTKKPPQWIIDGVKEQFNVDWEDDVIFTYGDVISSHTGTMSEDLLAHEGHHTVQQADFPGDPDSWWKLYLEDAMFRLNQELECYQKQYAWVKNNVRDRNKQFKLASHYATCLSGEMYGNLISYENAYHMICNG